jgi:tRNA 2-thiouridine synthesizing protein A
MKDVAPGGLLQILATDPGAPSDFVHFCETTGHSVVENSQAGEVFTIVIRKSHDS